MKRKQKRFSGRRRVRGPYVEMYTNNYLYILDYSVDYLVFFRSLSSFTPIFIYYNIALYLLIN